MAKNDDLKVGDAAIQESEFPLALEEFCAHMSQEDKRVELIGAFHHSEKRAGRIKDTGNNFRARYVAFCNQPA